MAETVDPDFPIETSLCHHLTGDTWERVVVFTTGEAQGHLPDVNDLIPPIPTVTQGQNWNPNTELIWNNNCIFEGSGATPPPTPTAPPPSPTVSAVQPTITASGSATGGVPSPSTTPSVTFTPSESPSTTTSVTSSPSPSGSVSDSAPPESGTPVPGGPSVSVSGSPSPITELPKTGSTSLLLLIAVLSVLMVTAGLWLKGRADRP